MTAISAVGLTKIYGAVKAVDNVSFDVEVGEVFSLLGPNGAGKTTTVEILECLRTPTSGDAYIMGLSIRDKSDERKIRKLIGVLPQEFNAVDNLTVLENVKLAAAAKKSDADYKELLEGLGLRDVRNRFFSKLSGGMKRKVGLVMALVGDPEVVFLDEPTTGLDPEARRETWRYLLELRRKGKTIFLTTHYMEEAERLSDRVAIMVKGRIATSGKVSQLISSTRTLKLIFYDADDTLVREIKTAGHAVTVLQGKITAVTLRDYAQLIEILKTLTNSGFRGHYEVRAAGLEEVFLTTVGSRLTEEGELL